MSKNRVQVFFDGKLNISNIEKELQKIKTYYGNIKLPAGATKELSNAYKELEGVLNEFKTQTTNPITSNSELRKVSNTLSNIETKYKSLLDIVSAMGKVGKKAPIKDLMTEEQYKLYSKINEKIKETKKEITDNTNQKKAIEDQIKQLKQYIEARKKVEQVDELLKRKEERDKASKEEKKNIPSFTSNERRIIKDAAAIKAKNAQILTGIDTHALGIDSKQLSDIIKDYDELNDKLSKFNQLKKEDAFKSMVSELDPQKIKEIFNIDVSNMENTTQLNDALKTFISGLRTEAAPSAEVMANLFAAMKDNVSGLDMQLDDVRDSLNDITNIQNGLEQSAMRVLNFFSVGNSIQIFKNIVRSAKESITELDAVMTETAVVTNFSIGDMWRQLPQYTKLANQLGVSIKGAYETMTIFYQQGLSTNEVMAVGTETMKMARIANLDYAKAADYECHVA